MAMKLMKDTCSLSNYLMCNDGIKTSEIKIGTPFVELMWSDRVAYVVTDIRNDKTIVSKRIATTMKDWTEGTEYPVKDADGNYKTIGGECLVTKPRKYWKMDGRTVHISWGCDCGYRDPSF